MDDKLLTDKTVLEWLTFDGLADELFVCRPTFRPTPNAPGEFASGLQEFTCGLAISGFLGSKNPMEGAAQAIRAMHERHHIFGHRPFGRGCWGFVLNGCPEHGFTADCLDCDPVPELGLEYDRNEMEANGVLPPW